MESKHSAEAIREPGLNRIREPQFDKHWPDFLVYYYLVKCIRQAGASISGRLLDIGCGNKPYRSLFPRVSEYVGCDIAQSSDNVVDVISAADDIPLESGSFDAVLSTQTIEHVGNFAGLLSESFRVLKPGGKLYLSG